jgi:hypothetical protein
MATRAEIFRKIFTIITAIVVFPLLIETPLVFVNFYIGKESWIINVWYYQLIIAMPLVIVCGLVCGKKKMVLLQ